MISHIFLLSQLMIAATTAHWVVPASHSETTTGPQNATLLQAQYDFNGAPSKYQRVQTFIQVGPQAVVGCVSTNHGREVSIARLSQSANDDVALQLEFSGPGISDNTLFVPFEDHAPGSSSGCDSSASFMAAGEDVVEFVTQSSEPPTMQGIPAWRHHRWDAVNITSGEVYPLGFNDSFGDGSALATLSADGRKLIPDPSSHVSLMDGAVRCVGIEMETQNGNIMDGAVYCWDTRLPTGSQVVAVAGAGFWNANVWAWADKYLVTVGHDGDEDYELFWADLSEPTSSPTFTKLHDNTDGSSFRKSDSGIENVAVLSDDLLCWHSDNGRGNDDVESNNHVHCHMDSQNTTFMMPDPVDITNYFEIAAAAVNNTVYVKTGVKEGVFAWELPADTITKLEDVLPSQFTNFDVEDVFAVSEEAGVAFSFDDQTHRMGEVAVTWKVGQDPVPIDGQAFDASLTGQLVLGRFAYSSENKGDLTPWSDEFATFRIWNLTNPSYTTATLVLVNRTTGIGHTVPGAEKAAVSDHRPMHVEYELSGGEQGQGHGMMFYMNPDAAANSDTPHAMYFYSFTEDTPTFVAASTFQQGLDDSAGVFPFASVVTSSGANSATALGITQFRYSEGEELLVFRPAAIAEAGARLPEEETLFNPSPAFSDGSSDDESAFTRGGDGALCMKFENTTLTDFACIAEGPRVSDGAVRLEFASQMPVHPLMDPESPKATAYQPSQELDDDYVKLQYYKRGLGRGFILFEHYDAQADESTFFYFDGHHAPVMIGGNVPFSLDEDAAAETASDGRFIYFINGADDDTVGYLPMVADLGADANITKASGQFGTDDFDYVFSAATVLYDRFFFDLMQTDGSGADIVSWDTQNLAAGPQIQNGGNIADDLIEELHDDDSVVNFWHPMPLMNGMTGEVLFGIKHEQDDDTDDDAEAATYFVGRSRAIHFDANGTMENIVKMDIRVVGASPGEWYQGPNGTGVVSELSGERGVIAVTLGAEVDVTVDDDDEIEQRVSGEELVLRLWNTRGLNEPMMNFTVPDLVRHAFVLDETDVLLITFETGRRRRRLQPGEPCCSGGSGSISDDSQSELIRLDVPSGELLDVTCEPRFLPELDDPRINRIGSEAVCWEPYSNAEDNDDDPVNQVVVCYFKGDDECKVFDLGKDTEDAGDVHPFARVPRSDPMDPTVAVAMIVEDGKRGQEPALMAIIAPSPSPSPSPSTSPSPSVSASPSNSPSPSVSASPSNSPTPSVSSSPSNSPTPSVSSSPSNSPTPSVSSSPSNSPTPTPSTSSSPSNSPTPSSSISPSTSPSTTASASPSTSAAASATPSSTSAAIVSEEDDDLLTCSDGIQNGEESDIDCGDASADQCPLCSEGRACLATVNCAGELICSNDLRRCVAPVREAGTYISMRELQITGVTPVQFARDLQEPFKRAVRNATGAQEVTIDRVVAAAAGAGAGSGRRVQSQGTAVDVDFTLLLAAGADEAAAESGLQAYVAATASNPGAGTRSLVEDLRAAAPAELQQAIQVDAASAVVERETLSGSVEVEEAPPLPEDDGEDDGALSTGVIAIIAVCGVVALAGAAAACFLCRPRAKRSRGADAAVDASSKAAAKQDKAGAGAADETRPAAASTGAKVGFSSEMV